MLQIFNRWYEGRTEIHYFDDLNNKNADSYVFPLVYTKLHWTAHVARQLTDFWMRHWQFLITTIISIVVEIAMSP